MTSSAIQWLQVAISSLTLAGIIFGVLKVLNRNNEEWRDRERRLVAIEEDLRGVIRESKEIVAFGAQLGRLEDEMKRVRDRLDTFLDIQTGRSREILGNLG